ncbi:hypothetical protein HDV00_000793 [Rhizophlyctis rosea]|nr:hypothetical protein HDV00_000793 [Rhizophlyctis rosea]
MPRIYPTTAMAQAGVGGRREYISSGLERCHGYTPPRQWHSPKTRLEKQRPDVLQVVLPTRAGTRRGRKGSEAMQLRCKKANDVSLLHIHLYLSSF